MTSFFDRRIQDLLRLPGSAGACCRGNVMSSSPPFSYQRFAIVVLSWLLAIAATAPAGATQAEFAEARAIYAEVNALIQTGQLTRRHEERGYCKPYEDTRRTLFVTRANVPRFFLREGGSDDSSRTMNSYYDASGRLRFVLISAGAVNKTYIEHRVWLARDGKRVREQRTLIKGPGYPFPNPWPEEDLARDALQEFAKPDTCDQSPPR